MSGVGKINIEVDSNLFNNIEKFTIDTLDTSKSVNNQFQNSNGLEELDLESLESNNEIIQVKEEKSIVEKISSGVEDFFTGIEDKIEQTASKVSKKVDSIVDDIETGWDDFKAAWSNDILPALENGVEKVGTFFKRTGATIALGATSLVEGILKFGEAIVDVAAIVGSIINTPTAAIIDVGKAINGAITGEEWESTTKKLWEDTKTFVSTKAVSEGFDYLYDNTSIGNWVKENSYFYEQVRSIGSGIGYVGGVVLLTIATGGIGGAAVAGTSGAGVSAAGLATTAGVAGIGSGTQDAWADGANIIEGLGYGAANGLWEGVQFYLGGKIGGCKLFGEGGKFLTNLSEAGVKTKILNSAGRIILDGADGGLEGFVQPLLGNIYKDGSYAEIFNEYGGWQNVFTQAAVGSISSSIGEGFDARKRLNFDENTTVKLKDSDITAKLKDVNTIENTTPKLKDSDIIAKLEDAKKADIKDMKLPKGFIDKPKSEIAKFFNDPNQFIISKVKELCDNTPEGTKLKNELQEKLLNVKNFSSRELENYDIESYLKKYLSLKDKIELKKIKKSARLDNQYTDIEKDIIQSYTKYSGPAITAYSRKSKTMFSNRIFDGTNAKEMSDYLMNANKEVKVYDKLGKYNDINNFVNAMDQIVEKSTPLKEDIIVYRGADSLFLDGNKVTTFNIGQRFNDPAHVSSSIIPTNIVKKHDIIIEIEVPKGTKAAYLEKFTGVNNYNQQELLFGRNNQFEITSMPREIEIDGVKKIKLKAKLVPSPKSAVQNLNLDHINGPNYANGYYKVFNNTKTISPQIDLHDMMNTLKGNSLLGRYESEVRDIHNRNLYNFDIPEHNVDHVERVMLSSMYMGNEMSLSPEEMNLLIEAAKYHDSGRINLRTDKQHAIESSKIARDNLKNKYSEYELNNICAAIEYHEELDSKDAFERILKKHNIEEEDINTVHTIAQILKDADALDRTRFPGNIDSKFLRTDIAPKMLKALYQIQEIRGKAELEKNVQNNLFNPEELKDIISLKKAKVPDYLINFWHKYRTDYSARLIENILKGKNSG